MSEREQMQFQTLIVGAGPAGLACAIRLKQLNPEQEICVIEKAAVPGGHTLSGAVIEPGPLDALLPHWREQYPGICVPAKSDEFRLLNATGSRRLPLPPGMKNHGNFIVSLGNLVAWMAEQAEALGVELFPGFPGSEVLFDADGQRVTGVRIGDMGLNADGSPGPNYTEGMDLLAETTIFAEGCRGHLGKQLIHHFQLDKDSQPQTYGIGMKELWQLPEPRLEPGHILHTIGWPLPGDTYGGSFVYALDENRLAIGFVVGLDYSDPCLEPFELFQQFKHHPEIHPLLEGGEIRSTGARALVEGGWQSLPRMDMPGALLIGDDAGTLNVPKIKGTHMAMQSGMLAAEHLHEQQQTAGYHQRFLASAAGQELYRVRNIRPGFHKGLWPGMANAALETLLGGRSPWTLRNHADHEQLRPLNGQPCNPQHPARSLPPRDRLASVYFAATEHEESQPVHLKVADTERCVSECREQYANPCTRFCPAGVYEMVEDEQGLRLQINAANCVHCKTCDIKDPYQNIHWTAPEGGSGPNYQNL